MKRWEGKTVLIADDDASNFLLLNYIVKNAGAEVIKAANGQEAVDVILNWNKSGCNINGLSDAGFKWP